MSLFLVACTNKNDKTKVKMEETQEMESVILQRWNVIIIMWLSPQKKKDPDWHIWGKRRENSGLSIQELSRLGLKCQM